ncbi:uncharacterized protein EV420DRAFT_1484634 [Desarmillaria tabescens]|uniref:Uncharacterized protein n=1 Tax=Armillaria tabescens TaxID=1929756 RepID=A0AA39MSL6_ARMTA|nr:uncharacterized protein EV420DRAFT_1484634 [Desarmillaria tabescens]KAK0444514.1 hypothetical protein EV420DRAFT_1484634 [Desarmillaria tabescens]
MYICIHTLKSVNIAEPVPGSNHSSAGFTPFAHQPELPDEHKEERDFVDYIQCGGTINDLILLSWTEENPDPHTRSFYQSALQVYQDVVIRVHDGLHLQLPPQQFVHRSLNMKWYQALASYSGETDPRIMESQRKALQLPNLLQGIPIPGKPSHLSPTHRPHPPPLKMNEDKLSGTGSRPTMTLSHSPKHPKWRVSPPIPSTIVPLDQIH